MYVEKPGKIPPQKKLMFDWIKLTDSKSMNSIDLVVTLLSYCIIWLILSVYFYRSESGFQLLVCSWDGTIAYADFTTEELGRPMSEEEKV